MPLRNVGDAETCLPEQRFRRIDNLLAMLQRAGGMIGDAEMRRLTRYLKINTLQKFRYITGDCGDFLSLLAKGEIGIMGEQIAVILDSRAAAGSIYQDGCPPLALHLAHADTDVVRREGPAPGLLPLWPRHRAATARILRHDHLATVAGQETDGRVIALGREDFLRA